MKKPSRNRRSSRPAVVNLGMKAPQSAAPGSHSRFSGSGLTRQTDALWPENQRDDVSFHSFNEFGDGLFQMPITTKGHAQVADFVTDDLMLGGWQISVDLRC